MVVCAFAAARSSNTRPVSPPERIGSPNRGLVVCFRVQGKVAPIGAAAQVSPVA